MIIIKRNDLKESTKFHIRINESKIKSNKNIILFNTPKSNDIINKSGNCLENSTIKIDPYMTNLQNEININIEEYLETDLEKI